MPRLLARALLGRLCQLVGARLDDRADCELLRSFLCRRDESAFAVLLQRHAALVWRVCRLALGHQQDAEDAFQAAFLVLARKAASIRNRETVGSWLHGVAYRISVRSKQMTANREARERRIAAPIAVPSPDFAVRELQALLTRTSGPCVRISVHAERSRTPVLQL